MLDITAEHGFDFDQTDVADLRDCGMGICCIDSVRSATLSYVARLG